MQTGLHAIGWGASRLAIALAGLALAGVLLYLMLVFVIVAVQAFQALGTG